MKQRFFTGALLYALTILPLSAQKKVDFAAEIQPIFQSRCVECHGPDKQKGKLRLDTKEEASKGGKSGPVTVAGQADKSELYRRITLPATDEDVMPNKGEPLTKAQTDLIRDWINQGAEWTAATETKAPAPAAPAAPTAPRSKTQNFTAAELRATANELRATAARIEATAARIEGTLGEAEAKTSPEIAVVPAPKAPPVKKAPAAPPFESLIPKPAPAELEAITKAEKQGLPIRLLALNSNAREASFRSQGTNVTDATLAELKNISTLAHLNLAGTKITDQGLANVAKLTNLTVLHLENTGITDAGIEHLKGLPNLSYLNLYGTAVTDKGLEQLKGLKSLRSLYLWQSKTTDAGVTNLQKALPELKISTGAELKAVAPKEEEKKQN